MHAGITSSPHQLSNGQEKHLPPLSIPMAPAAQHPVAPIPASLFDRPVSGSAFAAPSAALEEPQVCVCVYAHTCVYVCVCVCVCVSLWAGLRMEICSGVTRCMWTLYDLRTIPLATDWIYFFTLFCHCQIHFSFLSCPTQLILISISPRIVLFENFLDVQTCSALREVAQPRLTKSKVSAGALVLTC